MLALNAFKMLKETTEAYGGHPLLFLSSRSTAEQSVLILIAWLSSNTEILIHFPSSSDGAATRVCWWSIGILGQNAVLGDLCL